MSAGGPYRASALVRAVARRRWHRLVRLGAFVFHVELRVAAWLPCNVALVDALHRGDVFERHGLGPHPLALLEVESDAEVGAGRLQRAPGEHAGILTRLGCDATIRLDGASAFA